VTRGEPLQIGYGPLWDRYESTCRFTGWTNMSSRTLKPTYPGIILRLRRRTQRYEDLVRFSCSALEFVNLLGSEWVARSDKQRLRIVTRGLDDVPNSAAGDDVNHCTRSPDG